MRRTFLDTAVAQLEQAAPGSDQQLAWARTVAAASRYDDSRLPLLRGLLDGSTVIEGLAVDDGVRMSDLKGTLYDFARKLFGSDRRIIFHHSYFPFVEPGVDFAVDCAICGGAGCRVCKGSGWLEMGGAGMVHPNVLRAVGYDPDVYSGFAFGLGIERLTMMRSGVDDVRAQRLSLGGGVVVWGRRG